MTAFVDQLASQVCERGTPALVGLDPRLEQLPESLARLAIKGNAAAVSNAYLQFCCGVIDVVAPLVAAVKPQAAFFEQCGPHGMNALFDVMQYARRSGLLVILDGKRNDIGSTAAAYATAYLGRDGSAWGADALTVSPYLGEDSIEPFVTTGAARSAGIFVLVKTSNPGGGLFQDLLVDGRPLYRIVGEHVDGLAAKTAGACGYGDVGAVVGATYPEQLSELRQAMPHTWFLVPGYGSQGGTARDVAGAFDERGLGAIVNSSRDIIFAHARPEYERFGSGQWQQAVEAATLDMIEHLRTDTPAGKLGV